MTTNDIDYLRSLIRMDLRRRQKSVDKFEPMPLQSQEEAEEVLYGFINKIRWIEGVNDRLLAMREQIKDGETSENALTHSA